MGVSVPADHDTPALELIYQPAKADRTNTRYPDAITQVIDGSDTIDIVSPYLGLKVLRHVVGQRAFRLVTDLHACFGRLDRPLLEWMRAHCAHLRHLNNVHAKVLIGAERALMGSANLTEAALTRRNEMGCLLSDAPRDELAGWFEHIWQAAEVVDAARLDAILQAARASTPETQPTLSKATRCTGRLPPSFSANQTPAKVASRPAASAADVHQCARILTRLTPNRAAAGQVLRYLSAGLRATGLDADDPRLSYQFKTKLSVSVGDRYVVWCYRRSGQQVPIQRTPALGMVLDDQNMANSLAAKSRSAWTDGYTRPYLSTVNLPAIDLPEPTPAVLDLLARTVRQEVQRARPYTRGVRHSGFYAILMDDGLIAEVIARTHSKSEVAR